MTTVLNIPEQRVLLDGVSWETYERLIAERRSGNARFAYDRGMLEIMAPSRKHETVNETLSLLFQLLAGEFDIDFSAAGSTTFRREDLSQGFEPDACFYVRHVDDVDGKDEIDLNIDPPPDLVIEIDISRSSLKKLHLYAAVQVPEVWRYHDETLQILVLEGTTYREQAFSVSLPAVSSSALTECIRLSQKMSRPDWMRHVRDLARKN
jgi:Uma2 family endonuclease